MADNKVMFKVGLQSKIDSMISNKSDYQVGTFYLTSDTDRLYVGQEDGLKLLNRSVQFAKDLSELNALANTWASGKSAHKSELAYITDNNILAFWDGNNWTQINPDTYYDITSGSYGVSVANDIATVELTLESDKYDADGKIISGDDSGNSTAKASFKVTGEKGAKVSTNTDGDTVVITGDTYTLSNAVSGKDATIKLSSALGQAESKATISAGDNIDIKAGTNGNIVISAKDNSDNLQSIDLSIDVGDDTTAGALNLDYTTKTTTETETINLGYTLDNKFYGIGGNTAGTAATLPVYTKIEVDDKFKGLNELKYCGTIGTSGDHKLGATDKSQVSKGTTPIKVSNGNMFLVSGECNFGGSVTAKTGDLLIACGDEDADGYLTTIEWTYVPSGNDTELDTTYQFSSNNAQHKFTVSETTGDGTNTVGEITLANGTDINIVSTGSVDGFITHTISHADVAHKDNTSTTNVTVANNNFQAIDSVTVDAQGHVTQVNKATIKPVTYAPGAPILGDKTITTTLVRINGDGTVEDADFIGNNNAAIKLVSDTIDIKMSDSDHTITAELMWGSF